MATLDDSKYESNSGTIHSIRLTPAILAIAGTPPTGDVDSDIKAKVTKGNREFGIRPRRVTGSTKIGTAPNDFRTYVSVPVLTPAAFATPAFALNATFTYNSLTYTIISRENEDF